MARGYTTAGAAGEHPSPVVYFAVKVYSVAANTFVEFVRQPGHVSPKWPEGYWPGKTEQTDAAGWQKTIAGIEADLEAIKQIVLDPQTDLMAELAHAPGYTVLREALLAADHNVHHLGEFAILRQVMGTWNR